MTKLAIVAFGRPGGCSKLFAFGNQREVVLRRVDEELKGTLQ